MNSFFFFMIQDFLKWLHQLALYTAVTIIIIITIITSAKEAIFTDVKCTWEKEVILM